MLGRQHVAALVDAGARVVVSDIGLAQADATIAAVTEISPAADLVPLVIDVTSPASVGAAGEDLAGRGIAVDILVNNAAIDPKVTSTPGVMHSSRFEAFPVPQWQTEIAVGLTGAMLCSQVFGGAMAAARPRRHPQHRIRSRRDRAGPAALPAAQHHPG